MSEAEKKERWAKVVDLPTLVEFANYMLTETQDSALITQDSFGDACDRLWLNNAARRNFPSMGPGDSDNGEHAGVPGRVPVRDSL